MKSIKWQVIALALATLPVAAPQVPPNIEALRRMAGQDASSCEVVKVSEPLTFRGRNLVEIPDISEPDLRLANQLMSAGCFARAVNKLDTVLRADPANRNANYIIARMTWMRLGTGAAERELKRTLSEYGDFASAKVLLAGLRLEQDRVDEAVRLIDEVEPKSPTDLWIYMNRLRIETLRSPSRDLRVRLLEIIRNPGFPPNAREAAARSARSFPNQTAQEFEEVLRARLDIDSNVGTACKAADLATFLESQQRHSDVIKLLESPRSTAGNCLGMETNRMLLAQAYLVQAANISAGPTAANKNLVDKANALLDGDFEGLAPYVSGRPQAEKLAPFLAAHVQLESKLCHAIEQFDFVTVAIQLSEGADPNGTCRNVSLVSAIVYMDTAERPSERLAMMDAILASGAPLTKGEIEACRKSADCSKVLLRTLERYSSRAK